MSAGINFILMVIAKKRRVVTPSNDPSYEIAHGDVPAIPNGLKFSNHVRSYNP